MLGRVVKAGKRLRGGKVDLFSIFFFFFYLNLPHPNLFAFPFPFIVSNEERVPVIFFPYLNWPKRVYSERIPDQHWEYFFRYFFSDFELAL